MNKWQTKRLLEESIIPRSFISLFLRHLRLLDILQLIGLSLNYLRANQNSSIINLCIYISYTCVRVLFRFTRTCWPGCTPQGLSWSACGIINEYAIILYYVKTTVTTANDRTADEDEKRPRGRGRNRNFSRKIKKLPQVDLIFLFTYFILTLQRSRKTD